MDYRAFGSTGLQVSEIGFGCGNTAGLMVSGTPEQRREAVQHALDLGINYFDTAPTYGDGLSETNLGQTIRELGVRPIISTKIAFWPRDLDDIPGSTIESVDTSLQRLGLDRLDILFLHNRVAGERTLKNNAVGSLLSVNDVLGPRGVLETLKRLQTQGKVRFIGVCPTDGEPEANRQLILSGGFQCVQLIYNLFNPTEGRTPPIGFRGADYGQSIELARERGLGVDVIRSIAAGALSGLEERHPVSGGSWAERPEANAQYQAEVRRAQSAQFLAVDGQTLAQAAIRFALTNRGVSSVLVGFSDLHQIDDALAASQKGPLTAADLERIERLYQEGFA